MFHTVPAQLVCLRSMQPMLCKLLKINLRAWRRVAYTCEQVQQEEAVIFHRDKVRRPVPEDKAISRAVDMIRVRRSSRGLHDLQLLLACDMPACFPVTPASAAVHPWGRSACAAWVRCALAG